MSVIDNDIKVYILQHPDETKNAKGSSIIAKLYLKNTVTLTGEDFQENKSLNELYENQFDSTIVIYPGIKSRSLSEWKNNPNTRSIENTKKLNIIFIDASWRKSKKIWLGSRVLQQFNSIKLMEKKESNYRIRKIPESGHLSTIESIVVCLQTIENDPKKYTPLLDVFDSMIDYQIESMGEQTFNENYQNKGEE